MKYLLNIFIIITYMNTIAQEDSCSILLHKEVNWKEIGSVYYNGKKTNEYKTFEHCCNVDSTDVKLLIDFLYERFIHQHDYSIEKKITYKYLFDKINDYKNTDNYNFYKQLLTDNNFTCESIITKNIPEEAFLIYQSEIFEKIKLCIEDTSCLPMVKSTRMPLLLFEDLFNSKNITFGSLISEYNTVSKDSSFNKLCRKMNVFYKIPTEENWKSDINNMLNSKLIKTEEIDLLFKLWQDNKKEKFSYYFLIGMLRNK